MYILHSYLMFNRVVPWSYAQRVELAMLFTVPFTKTKFWQIDACQSPEANVSPENEGFDCFVITVSFVPAHPGNCPSPLVSCTHGNRTHPRLSFDGWQDWMPSGSVISTPDTIRVVVPSVHPSGGLK